MCVDETSEEEKMRKTRLAPDLHRLAYRAFQDIRQRCTDRDNKHLLECGARKSKRAFAREAVSSQC